MIIIEFINFRTFLFILLSRKYLKKNYGSQIKYIYENKLFFNFYIILIKNFIGFNIQKLNFKLIDIREDTGEILSLKILRDDLFQIEKDIEKKINNYFKNIKINENKINYYEKNYIYQSVLAENIKNKKSLWRIIFLINVINKLFHKQQKIILFNERIWQNIISDYSKIFNIKIIFINKFINLKKLFKVNTAAEIIKYIIKLSKYRKHNNKRILNLNNKILCESYGQVNLINKCYKSDFFWVLNSNFPRKHVFFNCENKKDQIYLNENNISSSLNYDLKSLRNIKIGNKLPKVFNNKNLTNEQLYINNTFKNYNNEKKTLQNFYKKNNIRAIFNWYRYDQSHILKHEAINEIGGISSLWQFAFEGNEYYDIKSFADINFSYSKFSSNIHNLIGSKFKQQVIVGLPTYKISSDLINESIKIKKSLMSFGAKKIICVLDENSVDDDRWHTGDKYQQEIYEKILNELFINNELGVIFKPKIFFTLKERLGSTYNLLNEALKTKRCFIYTDNYKRSTLVPPLIAALSSDLVIHSALSSGTAAIECAQKKIPTILIDREKAVGSKLNELPKNKIIFENFDHAIEAINNHFFQNKTIEGFGDWSKYIYEFDPFNDDKGAYRIGSYLNKIIDGYNQSLSKEKILSLAASQYSKEWGKDKVIY